MIENLLDYIDKLEKDLSITLVIETKKFVLTDMLPYFIDNDVRDLKKHGLDNQMIQQQRRYWTELCTKYKDYVDVKEIMDYFNKEIENK